MVGGVALRSNEPLPVAIDDDARRKAWGATTPEEIDGETLHIGGSLAFWLPSDAEGRVLVLGPEDLLRQSIEAHRAATGGGGGVRAPSPPPAHPHPHGRP